MKPSSWGLVALSLMLAFGVRTAFAHAELVASEPAPGASLSRPPAEVRLTFSEPLGAGSTFRLHQEGFQEVLGVVGHVDPADPAQLAADVPALEPGTYTVQWMALSQDSHTVRGSYAFSVRASRLPRMSSGVVAALLTVAGFAIGYALSGRRRA